MMTAIPSYPLWETKMTGTRDKMLPTMPTTLMTVIPATQLRTRTMRMKMTMMIEKNQLFSRYPGFRKPVPYSLFIRRSTSRENNTYKENQP